MKMPLFTWTYQGHKFIIKTQFTEYRVWWRNPLWALYGLGHLPYTHKMWWPRYSSPLDSHPPHLLHEYKRAPFPSWWHLRLFHGHKGSLMSCASFFMTTQAPFLPQVLCVFLMTTPPGSPPLLHSHDHRTSLPGLFLMTHSSSTLVLMATPQAIGLLLVFKSTTSSPWSLLGNYFIVIPGREWSSCPLASVFRNESPGEELLSRIIEQESYETWW